ncbi:MAG: DNA repair protein RecO [Oscillospiraceae bacterium]|nr:DNA repair protein RecO [Oscillospiraceae bacterium]
MYINTTGLVLRETAYKDSSKILTVLTGDEGKLTVSARGALRKNSKLMATTQLLAFSEMTIYCSRDRWTLTEARSVEQFIGLRDDIALLALGAYFAELAETVADEDCPNPDLLALCLNGLFALSEKIKTPEYVKPAFELRLMAISGFTPQIESCRLCGRRDMERAHLDLVEGTIVCGGCKHSDPISNMSQDGIALNRGAISAARYIINCDPKKLFSFSLGEAALRELAAATEEFLIVQLDRRFRTLDYYKEIAK